MTQADSDEFYRPPDLPAELQRYELLKRLGQGDFGVTWLATDRNLDRKVAIKHYYPSWFWVQHADSGTATPSPDDKARYARGLEAFLYEARLLAKISHPNCVQVYDVVETSGSGYMVMAYEHGKTLERLYRTDDMDNEQAYVRLLMPILDAVEALHRHHIIHADIKTDNVLIRVDGSPALLDFGSTRTYSVHDSIGNHSAMDGGAQELEQSRTIDGHFGPWTDIFALARVLYAGVNCGRYPPESRTRYSEIRDGNPDPMESAYRLGRGRYSERFLRAIDAALCVDLKRIPADISTWRNLFPPAELHDAGRQVSHGADAVDPTIARNLLCDDDARIRIAALKIPSREMPNYHAWLIDELSSAHVERRLGALTALFELKHPELEMRLMRLAAEKRWSVRRRAIFYLGEIRCQNAISLVSALMSDHDPGIRAEAREAMKKIRPDG